MGCERTNIPEIQYPENNIVHFDNQKLLGRCSAGEIWTARLSAYNILDYHLINPTLLNEIGPGFPKSEKMRRGLVTKLHQNSPSPCPLIGKPSSSFVLRNNKGKYHIDYLIESPDFVRDPRRTLHSYILELDNVYHSDRFHPHNLFGRNTLWSGHIARINSPFTDGHFVHIHLFDKFERASTIMDAEDIKMLHVVNSNGMLPLTSDGKIINVKSR